MRKLIQTSSPPFDMATVKEEKDAIIKEFDAYLDSYRAKNSKSKHAIMGPIAKVLDKTKTRKWQTEAIKGFALRIHEMSPQSSFVSHESLQHLSNGVEKLMLLCDKVPPLMLNRVLEQIDYEVYFARRSKMIQWLEDIRQSFIKHLKNKYKTIEALRSAWNENDLSDFDSIRYPSRTGKFYTKGNEAKKADIDEFAKLTPSEKQSLLEEDEND